MGNKSLKIQSKQSKQSIKLKKKIMNKLKTLHLNYEIKRYNRKYNKDIKLYDIQKKQQKKICAEDIYPFKPCIVKIKYYKNGKRIYQKNNIKYSYVYKGVPGGWYY